MDEMDEFEWKLCRKPWIKQANIPAWHGWIFPFNQSGKGISQISHGFWPQKNTESPGFALIKHLPWALEYPVAWTSGSSWMATCGAETSRSGASSEAAKNGDRELGWEWSLTSDVRFFGFHFFILVCGMSISIFGVFCCNVCMLSQWLITIVAHKEMEVPLGTLKCQTPHVLRGLNSFEAWSLYFIDTTW